MKRSVTGLLPRCCIALGATLGVTLGVALGVASPAFGFSPGRAPCEPAAKGEIVRRARKVFPKAGLQSAYGCHYWGGRAGGVMHSSFARYTVQARAARIRFTVVDGKGILFKQRRPRFFLVPFPSRSALRRTAQQLRRHPLIRRAFGNRPLHCTAGTDAPGAAAYYACAARPLKGEPLSLKVSRHAPVVKFSQRLGHPEYGGRRGAPEVVEYALPASRLTPQATRWAEARKHPQVVAHLRRYPRAGVVLERWHQHYLSVVPPGNPKDKVVVVWSVRRWRMIRTGIRIRRVRTGGGIARVCRTAKAMDCVNQVMYPGRRRRHRRRRP